MSASNDMVDSLVEIIASRVAARMHGTASSSHLPVLNHQKDPGFDPTAPCDATQESCNGCGFCATRKESAVDHLIQIGADRIGASPGGVKPRDDMASMIDHTLLKADATREELRKVCQEARQWKFATVCVNAANIGFVAKELHGSGVKPIAVVGFPLGATLGTAKAFEAREAVRQGAREIDMVINVGEMKSGNYAVVLDDICRVVAASKPYPVKVILETAFLNDEQKVIACALSKAAGAAFVKTSTGFGPGGATEADIRLMRRVVGGEMGVKASGGVRTKEDADKMIAAGANRIGASASVAIVTGGQGKGAY